MFSLPRPSTLCFCREGFLSHNQLPAFIGHEDKSRFFIVIVKQGNPSAEELHQLAGRISNKWKPLGRQLGFDDDQLTGFHKDNEEYREKPYAMLLAWERKNGDEATYEVLHEALCKAERRDLAEKFCQ